MRKIKELKLDDFTVKSFITSIPDFKIDTVKGGLFSNKPCASLDFGCRNAVAIGG